MARDKLQEAQHLLKQKRYEEARRLLRQIDHPTAKRWLAKLDEIAPEAKQGRSLALGFVVIIGIIVLVGIVLAAIAQVALRPTGNAQIVSIPTLAELPSNTPSQTPTNTPTVTPTPTSSPTDIPTVTPTATITDTPIPSATSTSTNTPTITPSATQACYALEWYLEVSNLYLRANLNSDLAIDSLHRTIELIPFPQCVSIPREFLMKHLEETKLAILALGSQAFYTHLDRAKEYHERFSEEMDLILD